MNRKISKYFVGPAVLVIITILLSPVASAWPEAGHNGVNRRAGEQSLWPQMEVDVENTLEDVRDATCNVQFPGWDAVLPTTTATGTEILEWNSIQPDDTIDPWIDVSGWMIAWPWWPNDDDWDNFHENSHQYRHVSFDEDNFWLKGRGDAPSACYEYAAQAVQNFCAGNEDLGFFYLSLASHYMVDVGCPVHTDLGLSDHPDHGDVHGIYERWVQRNINDFWPDPADLEPVIFDDVEQAVRDLADSVRWFYENTIHRAYRARTFWQFEGDCFDVVTMEIDTPAATRVSIKRSIEAVMGLYNWVFVRVNDAYFDGPLVINGFEDGSGGEILNNHWNNAHITVNSENGGRYYQGATYNVRLYDNDNLIGEQDLNVWPNGDGQVANFNWVPNEFRSPYFHNFRVVIDEANDFFERGLEDNNVYNELLPDLYLDDDDIFITPEGDISITVHNEGQDMAYSILVEAKKGTDGTSIGTATIAEISPGGTGTCSIPLNGYPGSQEILIEVDPNDTITEENEGASAGTTMTVITGSNEVWDSADDLPSQIGYLVIKEGAQLTINSITVTMDSGWDGKYFILVEEGGILNINGAILNGGHEYYIVANGEMNIVDSEINDLFPASTRGGMQIYSDDVTIGPGSIIQMDGDPTVVSSAIYIRGCSPDIIGSATNPNTITVESDYGIMISGFSARPTIQYNNINLNSQPSSKTYSSIIVDSASAIITDNTIVVTMTANPELIPEAKPRVGIMILDGNIEPYPIVKDNLIKGGYEGIFVSNSIVMIEGNTITLNPLQVDEGDNIINVRYGMDIWGHSQGIIKENDINTVEVGVNLWDSSPTFEDNQLSTLYDFGYCLGFHSAPVIIGDTITNAFDFDFYLGQFNPHPTLIDVTFDTSKIHYDDDSSVMNIRNDLEVVVEDSKGDPVPGAMVVIENDRNDYDIQYSTNPADPDFLNTPYPNELIEGDFDDDGDMDLITSNFPGGSISFFRNYGDGTFVNDQNYQLTSACALSEADFDLDGDLDLVVAESGTGTVTILRNFGDGFFEVYDSIEVDLTHPDEQCQEVSSADFDGDGDVDIVVLNYISANNYEAAILMNNGEEMWYDATVGNEFAASVTYAVDAMAEMSIAYIDSDEWPDIITGGSNDVSILFNNGDGTFGTPCTTYSTQDPVDVINDVYVSDFNRDGYKDIVVPIYSSSVDILWGDGDGTFDQTSWTTYSVSGAPIKVQGGDLNRDGIVDIVSTNGVGDTVAVLLGNYDGTFRAPYYHDMGTGNAPNAVCVADFDRDDFNEIAVADLDNEGIGILLDNTYTFTDEEGKTGPIELRDYLRTNGGITELSTYTVKVSYLESDGTSHVGQGTIDLSEGANPFSENTLTISLGTLDMLPPDLKPTYGQLLDADDKIYLKIHNYGDAVADSYTVVITDGTQIQTFTDPGDIPAKTTVEFEFAWTETVGEPIIKIEIQSVNEETNVLNNHLWLIVEDTTLTGTHTIHGSVAVDFGVTLTIDGATIDMFGTLRLDTNSNVIMQNMANINFKCGIFVMGGTLTVTDCTIDFQESLAAILNYDGTVTIQDSSLTGSDCVRIFYLKGNTVTTVRNTAISFGGTHDLYLPDDAQFTFDNMNYNDLWNLVIEDSSSLTLIDTTLTVKGSVDIYNTLSMQSSTLRIESTSDGENEIYSGPDSEIILVSSTISKSVSNNYKYGFEVNGGLDVSSSSVIEYMYNGIQIHSDETIHTIQILDSTISNGGTVGLEFNSVSHALLTNNAFSGNTLDIHFMDDWTVTDGDSSISGATVLIEGNLLMENSCSLTLISSTINILSSSDGDHKITVNQGSTLDIQSSTITKDSTYKYGFEVHGDLYISSGSVIEYMHDGIKIDSLTSCIIQIFDSFIRDGGAEGIRYSGPSHAVISGNTFSGNTIDIHFTSDWTVTDGDSSISGATVLIDGNLLVENSRSLMLISSTINILSSSDGGHKITVNQGSTLDIQSSTITKDSTYKYGFEVHGNLYVSSGSVIEHMHDGIKIDSLYTLCIIQIFDSFIQDGGAEGIRYTGISHAVISGNTFSGNTIDIHFMDDWIVTDGDSSIAGATVLIEGDLVIQNMRTLDLSSTILRIKSLTDGDHGITIESDGTLNALSSIMSKSEENAIKYGFIIHGNAQISSGTIEHTFNGIQIDSGPSCSVTIDGNTISDYNLQGIIVTSSSPTITGNTIVGDGPGLSIDYGIYCIDGSPTVNNNNINENDYGIYLDINSDPASIHGNILDGNRYGIYIDQTTAVITLSENTIKDDSGIVSNDCGIYIYLSSPVVDNNNVILDQEYGINIISNPTISSSPTISNNDAPYGIYRNTYGIFVDERSSPTISGNILDGNAFGIYLDRTIPTLTISDNIITDSNGRHTNDCGIYVDRTSPIIGNNNGICHQEYGIKVMSTSTDISSPSIFGNSGGQPFWDNTYGIHIDTYSAPLPISGNRFEGNLFGIYLDGTNTPVTISGNLIEDSAALWSNDCGIYCYESSPVITNNNIIRWQEYAIKILSGTIISSPTISGDLGPNGLHQNTYGVYLDASSTPAPINNNLFDGNEYGIYLDGTIATVTISGNTIQDSYSGNNDCGIYIEDSSPMINNNNDIKDQEYGIKVISSTGTSAPVINGNAGTYGIYGNTNGIYVDASSNPTVTSNFIYYNNDGIHLYGTTSCSISNNDIRDNIYSGIYIANGATPTITSDNAIHYNNNGIFIDNSNPVIQSLTVSHNTIGIYLSSSSPTIQNNIIQSNTDGIFSEYETNAVITANTFAKANTNSDLYFTGNWYIDGGTVSDISYAKFILEASLVISPNGYLTFDDGGDSVSASDDTELYIYYDSLTFQIPTGLILDPVIFAAIPTGHNMIIVDGGDSGGPVGGRLDIYDTHVIGTAACSFDFIVAGEMYFDHSEVKFILRGIMIYTDTDNFPVEILYSKIWWSDFDGICIESSSPSIQHNDIGPDIIGYDIHTIGTTHTLLYDNDYFPVLILGNIFFENGWQVNSGTTSWVPDAEIKMQGDLSIQGTLILDTGSELKMKNDGITHNKIDVLGGGTFSINGATITSFYQDPTYNFDFYFKSSSTGSIIDSTIEYVGYYDLVNPGSFGIKILTNSITIEGSTIQNCYYGLLILSSPTIGTITPGSTNTFDSNFVGIYVFGSSSSPNLYRNNYQDNGYGIYLKQIISINLRHNTIVGDNIDITGDYGIFCYSTSILIDGNSENMIQDCGYGIYFHQTSSSASVTEMEIQNNYFGIFYEGVTSTTINNNDIHDNTCGIYFYDESTSNFVGNTFNNNGYDIYFNTNWVAPSLSIPSLIIGLDGDLTINNGITLTLSGTTLYMDPEPDAQLPDQHVIDILNGGVFNIQSGSNILTIGDNYDFFFRLGSTGTIDNSNIYDAGYDSAGSSYGIKLESGSTVTVTGSLIRDCERGFYIQGSSSATITGSTIINCQYGIYMQGSSGATITGGTIRNCQYGIYIEGSSPTIESVQIRYNTIAGVYIDSTGSPILRLNTIYQNPIGIHLYGTSSLTMDQNTIEGNNNLGLIDYGIKIENSATSSIEGGNIILKNNFGVYVDSSSSSSIIGNTFRYNDESIIYHGISPSTTSISNNIIQYASAHGIHFIDLCRSTISGNTFTGGTLEDIAFDGGWEISTASNIEDTSLKVKGDVKVMTGGILTLTSVTLKMNQDGANIFSIIVETGGTLNIHSSTITRFLVSLTYEFKVSGTLNIDDIVSGAQSTDSLIEHSKNGIEIYSSSSVSIADTVIKDSLGDGIYIYNDDSSSLSVSIADTVIEDSLGDGIYIYNDDPSAPSVSITNTDIKYSLGDGIHIFNDDPSTPMAPTISYVHVLGSLGGDGIHCYYSSPSVSNCLLEGNVGYGLHAVGARPDFDEPDDTNEYRNNLGDIDYGSGVCQQWEVTVRVVDNSPTHEPIRNALVFAFADNQGLFGPGLLEATEKTDVEGNTPIMILTEYKTIDGIGGGEGGLYFTSHRFEVYLGLVPLLEPDAEDTITIDQNMNPPSHITIIVETVVRIDIVWWPDCISGLDYSNLNLPYLPGGGTQTIWMKIPKTADLRSISSFDLTGIDHGGFPSYVELRIGNDPNTIWVINGDLIGTVTIDDSNTGPNNPLATSLFTFSEALQLYVDTNFNPDEEGYIYVPLTLSSASEGELEISNINVMHWYKWSTGRFERDHNLHPGCWISCISIDITYWGPGGVVIDDITCPNIGIHLTIGDLLWNRPAEFREYYFDENQDGVVDDTSIPESTLKMYWFDDGTQQWRETGEIFGWQNTGVNNIENYVWTNVEHFSNFSLNGSYVPIEETEDLINTLDSMEINPGIKNSLRVKLEGALSHLNIAWEHFVDGNLELGNENLTLAIDKLNDFKSEVEAQRGKAIKEEDAGILINKATEIIALVEKAIV